MQLSELDRFVGKYVDISDEENNGGSGWVVKVDPPYTHSQLGEGRMVHFDYGMGFFVTDGIIVQEVQPPLNDPGLFNPDNKPLPFP
jgi:hypothetical protein